MARYSALLLSSLITPMLDTGMYNLPRVVAIPAAGISNGDYVPIATIQRNGRILGAKMAISATLGASAVATLAVYRAGVLVANITAATTAGAASIVSGVALANLDVLAGDEIVIVASGANFASAATATVDIHLQH